MNSQFDVKFLDIGHLTMYNQDFDDDGKTPKEWLDFRQEVKALDGVLFVTPEYNRSTSAVLKNALDIASRPHGKNVWGGKPGAVVGVSPSKMGSFGSVQHLRQTATCLNVNLMGQPEAYIGEVHTLVNEKGLVNEGVKEFFKTFSNAFAAWVNRLT